MVWSKDGWRRIRGRGPFRENWVSICSRHYDFSPDCGMCTTGHWHNHWKWRINNLIYRTFPRIWVWWMNR